MWGYGPDRTGSGSDLIWRLRAPDQGSTVSELLSVSRLKSIMKGASFADVAAIQERVTAVLRSFPKEAFADSFQKLYELLPRMAINLKANKVNLFVSSVLFVFWYHSPNFLDTPLIVVFLIRLIMHGMNISKQKSRLQNATFHYLPCTA
jgi:hypothetical protein